MAQGHPPPPSLSALLPGPLAAPALPFLRTAFPGAVFTHTAPPVLCSLWPPSLLLPHLTVRPITGISGPGPFGCLQEMQGHV